MNDKMRQEKEITDMYDMFNVLSDSYIFDQKYRDGVMDALFFVLTIEETKLSRLKRIITQWES